MLAFTIFWLLTETWEFVLFSVSPLSVLQWWRYTEDSISVILHSILCNNDNDNNCNNHHDKNNSFIYIYVYIYIYIYI